MGLNFKQFAADGERFVKELATELGYPADYNRTARVMRSVFHTVRDILSPEESVELLAQLPMFLKAVYVEGWSLKPKKDRIRSVSQFITAVRLHDRTASERDFASDEEVELAVVVIFNVLHKYVSLGEMEDIRAVLPKEIKPLLNQILMV
ncbi:MAG TPA: DUF2267 domain-containing protein [Saprospiraceae bacterium]|nr:DUF2267 domain-containing protein [Saprospiraceae bacterium]